MQGLVQAVALQLGRKCGQPLSRLRLDGRRALKHLISRLLPLQAAWGGVQTAALTLQPAKAAPGLFCGSAGIGTP